MSTYSDRLRLVAVGTLSAHCLRSLAALRDV